MDSDALLLHQSCYYPFESIEKLKEFLEEIGSHIKWQKVGFLADEDYRNQIFILFAENSCASFRLNIPEEELSKTMERISTSGTLEYRHLQGKNIIQGDLSSIESLLMIWDKCKHQSQEIPIVKLQEVLLKVREGRAEKGRNKQFSKDTVSKVMIDSHGHCMFEGCGEELDLDLLTGQSGNYSYNAHIVASAETGPRGIPFFSEQLSDDPNNVMLLCDKHHRLIDRIALADYSASRLSNMRLKFLETARSLLRGLSYQSIPVYSVLWPIGGYSSAPPSVRDIALSLSFIKSRIFGERIDIDDNSPSLMKRPEKLDKDMDELVNDSAGEILGKTRKYGYKAALFAFGPMPALVGLGAALGNKNEITPMLRYRDGNCWIWPQNQPMDCPYDILFEEYELNLSKEVTLSVALTAYPDSMKAKARELGHPHIQLTAKSLGNAAIPHPENGYQLTAELQKLLLKLKDKHNIERVHLLICASNAACVFVGQSYDLYHPELLVYDFDSNGMLPKLLINSEGRKVRVASVNAL